MIKNRNKWISTALITCFTVFILAACSSNDNESGSDEGGSTNSDSIVVWAWDPNFNIAAINLAEEHYEEEGFTLEIQENAQDDIVQRLNTGLSSGTMNGMPNIVLIEDQRAQSFLQSYPDAFYPLGDYFNTEDFAEYKIPPTSLDGEQYGLPFDTGVTGLFYRSDYLEEAGYTHEDLVDITWEKYIDIAKDVKEETGHPIFSFDPSDFGIIRMMIQSAGTWFTTEDGEINLENNEALKESLEILHQLVDQDLVSLHNDWSGFLASFNSGEAATVPTGNWIVPSIEAEESQAGLWKMAPIPRLSTEGSVNATNNGGSSFYVLNIDGKEAAAEFLGATFGSDIDFYNDLVQEVGALGTFIPAAESEGYQFENEFFGGQQLISELSEWMEDVPAVNYGLNTYGLSDILVEQFQQMLNGKSVEDVLSDAQTQAENQFR
ncbi:ABC transporter substrate-binding protein [Gracilibacillus alcaliphilus]|uniref:ABC transporter substrate-binding protein n=1 Tax=Gracilibacillus alcaliphilus TaxID=1401441 RepID=UPI00195C497D|nr:extracellular solute-binding protein [Gracilibacillus alcaliphilus]MBM7679054.1 lactose/L-arabinose transport system substrate-binding protein [Gracilibacillus alcaliphilus]